jgi:hypothetical protein
MKMYMDEEEEPSPHGKGHIETVKFIATNREMLKCKRSLHTTAGTDEEKTARPQLRISSVIFV